MNESIGGSGTSEYVVPLAKLCHGLLGVPFPSCILGSNKCPCVKAVESQ